ncbi:hypothetical protein [Sphingobacterium faecium]|uniref:hypothetical protein n=1 Tax=Sphingobacterium faecium TaxID=34087 RepID=UPI00320AF4E3
MDNIVLFKWEPIEIVQNDFYFISLMDNKDGLKLIFEQEQNDFALNFDFGYHCIFYQNQNENSSLKIIDDYGINGAKWSLYYAKESKLIDEISQNSYGIIDKNELCHFIILHADGLLNILSSEDPKVSWQVLDKI